MDELISDFLADNYTPEQVEYLTKIIEALEQFDFSVESALLSQINDVERKGLQDVKDDIILFLDDSLNQAFALFGIQLTEEINYVQKYDLLEAILELEYYTETHAALQILDTNNTPQEALSELLESTTDIDAGEYLTYLEKVSPSLVERLKTIYSEKDSGVEAEAVVDPVAQERANRLYTLYRDLHHDELGLLGDRIRDGLPTLLPFETYLKELLPYQENNEVPLYARGLVLAALVCNDSLEERATQLSNSTPWLVLIQNHLEDLHPNPGIALRIQTECKRLLMEYQDALNQSPVQVS